jgi:hypothetical protein
MLAVELSGSNGEKLQLASGKSATLTFPITAVQQADAPMTIPLWYFDQATGMWKEEGNAKRRGNTYVGVVTHFSFWNVDVPYPLIEFSATFTDQRKQPLSGLKVIIKGKIDTCGITGSGFTDASGMVKGKIPANPGTENVHLFSMRCFAVGSDNRSIQHQCKHGSCCMECCSCCKRYSFPVQWLSVIIPR